MPTFFIALGGLLFSVAALAWFPLPYVFIAACWLVIIAIFFFQSQTAVQKSIWFNLAFILGLLAALEIYSCFSLKEQNGSRLEDEYKQGYFSPSEILGYGPPGEVTVNSRKLRENQLLYDVKYTIGSNGLRITPPGKIPNENECIVFFGDSLTIGQGVNDHESMPWIVGTLQAYKVHNFGFHGYGPHQMLSIIENGLIDCKPRFAIFQTMKAHVYRAAGYAPWDKHGPKYVLRDGRLVRDGHFDDRDELFSLLKILLETELEKSQLYRKYQYSEYRVTDDDIQLYLHIVDTARRKLVEAFPGLEFRVVLWDKEPDDRIYLQVKDGFESLSIRFHLVSDMLPGLRENPEKYELNIYDPHPNALAHQLIAEYVAEHILD